MLIVLSPAKTLDYDTPATTTFHSVPELIDRSAHLIDILKKMRPAQIASLMSISDPLAQLNAERYAAWTREFTIANAKQAVLAFNGDVYEGLDAPSLSAAKLNYLQSHVRILSGLHGVLRPLDLLQPYRLEMGTKLANGHGKDLYAFWGDTVTDVLNRAIAESQAPALINLASEEYFKAVRPRRLGVPVITPVFEDWKGGRYKVISFFAKRARGMMTRYAAMRNLRKPDALKSFDIGGYRFDASASTDSTWMFRRRAED